MYIKLCLGLLLVLGVISVTSCDYVKDLLNEKEYFSRASSEPEPVPFSIGPNSEGEFVFFNQDGKQIEPELTDLPADPVILQSMTSISMARIKGSCYYIVNFRGNTYKFELSPASCEYQKNL